MASETNPIEARRLGEQERLFHYLHGYSGLIAVQVLHLEGRVDEDRLRAALAHVQRLHPLLSAHIRYGETVFRSRPPYAYRQPWFETAGTAPVPLRIIDDADPLAWRRVLKAELSTPLAVGKTPRLRATLVRPNKGATTQQLFLTADHAIADAQTTNRVSRDILEFLAKPSAPGNGNAGAPGLPEPLEARLPKQTAPEGPYVPAQRIPVRKTRGPMSPGFVAHSLPPTTTDRLRAAIRANRTTLHGAVSAAFHTAFRQKYGLAEMTQISSVDLRRLCRPVFPAETVGCYIDLMRTAHRIDGGFWDIARDVSFKLITTLARDRLSASLMKLPGWDVYRQETVPTMTHKRRLDGLGITTAGESGLVRDYGPLTLTGVTMMVSTVMFGSALFVISSERLGGLDLYAGYSEDALDPGDAADIMARVAEALEAAAA